jgi:hypothetical protein
MSSGLRIPKGAGHWHSAALKVAEEGQITETQLHDIVNAPSTGGAEFTRIKNLKDKPRR